MPLIVSNFDEAVIIVTTVAVIISKIEKL